MDSGADHLAGQTADAERGIWEDHALGEGGRLGAGLGAPGDGHTADGVQRDEGADRHGPFDEGASRRVGRVGGRSVSIVVHTRAPLLIMLPSEGSLASGAAT